MKFRVTFKSPDGVSDSMNDAAQEAILKDKDEEFQEAFYNLSHPQRREAIEEVKENLYEFTSRWISGGEYITVEFNSDTNTAMVVPQRV